MEAQINVLALALAAGCVFIGAALGAGITYLGLRQRMLMIRRVEDLRRP